VNSYQEQDAAAALVKARAAATVIETTTDNDTLKTAASQLADALAAMRRTGLFAGLEPIAAEYKLFVTDELHDCAVLLHQRCSYYRPRPA
jgi:hypothetical protein